MKTEDVDVARKLIVVYLVVLTSAAARAQTGEPITVKGDKFYAGAEEFRVWGFSLVHGLSLSDEQLKQSMDRLEFLGANMVRLHTIFQSIWPDWSGNPCGILPTYTSAKTSRELANLDAYWRFINALRARGIYYTINHVQRRVYLPGDADVLATTEADKKAWQETLAEILSHPRPDTFYLNRFDERCTALEAELATKYLNLVNPKTARKNADDPYFAMIESVNETTGPRWIVENRIMDRLPAYFRTKFVDRWCDYLTEKYGDEDKLKAAWEQKDSIGLAKEESLTAKTIGIHPVLGEFEKYSAARSRDLLEFLVSLDMAFARRMKDAYRKAGFKGPSNYGDISLCPGGNGDYLWTKPENADLCDFWTDHDYPDRRVTPLRWPDLRCVKTCIRAGVSPHPYAWDRPYWRAEWRTRNAERIVDPLFCATYFSLTGIDGYTPHSWEMRHDRDWYGTVGLLANQVTVFDLNGDIPWQMVYRAAGRLFRSREIKPLTDVETLRRFLTNANVKNDQVDRNRLKGQLLVDTEHFSAVATDHPGRYEFDDLEINISSDGPGVVIVERMDNENVDYDYEITAVGQAGDGFDGGDPIKWDPVKFVQGGVTFKKDRIVESFTWLRDDGTTLKADMPIDGPTMPFCEIAPLAPKGVSLYRAKVK